MMDSKKAYVKSEQIVHQVVALEPQIRTTFAQDRIDYRGRVINLVHALQYFYYDLYRMAEIGSRVLALDASIHILDVGIAYGFLSVVLKQQYGRNITGVELPENVPIYCDIVQSANVPVIAGGLGWGDWPVVSESFDLIILGEVLEHLRISPLRALNCLRDSLRPGGHLLLTTPNIARLYNIIRLAVGRNILEEFPDDDAQLAHITDSVTHIREYTQSEVTAILARSGFIVEDAWHSWSWDRYNRYLWNFWHASIGTRIRAQWRAALCWFMPRFRHEMMFLARKV